LRSYSRSTLNANASPVPKRSTWTEWSMTRSAGTSGLTAGRIAARFGHRVPHHGEIDDRRHAGEVLHDHPRRHERDLSLAATPGRHDAERLDVSSVDHATGVTQQVLEQDPDRDGQARFGGQALDGPQTVDIWQAGPRDARAPKGSADGNACYSVGSLDSMHGSVPRSARRQRRPGRTQPHRHRGSVREALGPAPGDDPERDRAETEAAIQAAGIDLDPVPPGYHRHGDGEVHADGHAHLAPAFRAR
jgi:hypothetical protein